MRRIRSYISASLLLVMVLCASTALARDIVTKTIPLERNGVQLFLQKMHEAGKGHREPVLLVHGLTFSSHEFDLDYSDYSLARALARQGHSVWMLDIAGYARSQEVKDGFMPDSDYAAEDINAAVDAIVKNTGYPTVNILGWSWGTVTGSRFAAKYPDKVGKLILYAPIVAGLGQHDVTEAFKTEAWKGADEDFQRTKDNVIDPAITDPEVVKLFDKNTALYDNHPVPNGGRRDLLVAADKRLLPSAKLTMPVLVLVGDADPYVSVDLAKEAVAAMPANPKLVVFAGGGHALFMEIPHYKQFQKEVSTFLAK